VTIRPTGADVAIARTVARETGPAPQRLARALTYVPDPGSDICGSTQANDFFALIFRKR
jgi:hypothetical protein